jgi:hypothetical protein
MKSSDAFPTVYAKPDNIDQANLLQFLGPVQHVELVVTSKLNDRGKLDLDSPLNINEFDNAIR